VKVWVRATAEDLPIRLDRFVLKSFEQMPTRAFARKAIKRGEVSLNGALVESGRFLKVGDEVELLASRRTPQRYEMDLKVLFEDDHMAVVDKPAGIETSGAKLRVLEHGLLGNLVPSPRIDALPQPRVAHRLDYQTQGLVLCGKTASAHARLGRSFQAREVFKRYRAIVGGRIEGDGQVDIPLDGRSALTRWRATEHTRSLHIGWQTSVDLWPETGRTHQLRRHMASLGHPILGDALYTKEKLLRGQGLFLCAIALRFPHPVTGEEMTVERDEPHRFVSFRRRETRRWSAFPQPA
jgi:23S rRNA pseudouridine1911/1915/1917 synthase